MHCTCLSSHTVVPDKKAPMLGKKVNKKTTMTKTSKKRTTKSTKNYKKNH